MAVSGIITPVLQKAEKTANFPKRLEAVSIEFDFHKFQFKLSRSRFNAFLYVLEHFHARRKMHAKFRWHYISVRSLVLSVTRLC